MKINGSKIREIREERGMSLAELAAKSKVSVSFLSEIETGRKSPSLRTIEKIINVLNISKSIFLSENMIQGIELGERVRLIRNEKNLTLSKIAERTGYSISYMSDIETGKVLPSIEAVKKLADVLDVPVTTIVDSNLTFGQKLKRVREEQGITQSNIATLSNLSTGLIGQLETGKVQPSLSTIEKIAEALSISPCYFILNGAGPEDMLQQMSPDLKDLLANKEVQSVLKLLCHSNKKEIEFILNFIKLYKQTGLNDDQEEES